MSHLRKPVLANLAAIGAAFAAIIAVTTLWVVNLRYGPRLDAFTAGAMLIAMPVLLVLVTALWVVIRALFARRRFGPVATFFAGATLACAVIVGYCGPTACFVSNANRMIGWFVVLGTALAALAHHAVLDRFAREEARA